MLRKTKFKIGVPLIAIMFLTSCTDTGQLPRLNVGVPEDDGSACYEERRTFYVASRNARATDAILSVAGAVAAGVFRGFFNQLPFIGGTTPAEIVEGLAGLQKGMAEDRNRMIAFRSNFDALSSCRAKRASAINREYRRGNISKADANAELAGLKSAQREDIQVARETNVEIGKRTDNFALSVRKSSSQAREKSVGKKESREAEKSLQTNQRELKETEKTVEVAEAKTEGTFEEIARWLRDRIFTRFA